MCWQLTPPSRKTKKLMMINLLHSNYRLIRPRLPLTLLRSKTTMTIRKVTVQLMIKSQPRRLLLTLQRQLSQKEPNQKLSRKSSHLRLNITNWSMTSSQRIWTELLLLMRRKFAQISSNWIISSKYSKPLILVTNIRSMLLPPELIEIPLPIS